MWDGRERRQPSAPITERTFAMHEARENEQFRGIEDRLDHLDTRMGKAEEDRAELLDNQRCIRRTWDRFQAEHQNMLDQLREANVADFVKRADAHITAFCTVARTIQKMAIGLGKLLLWVAGLVGASAALWQVFGS